MRDMTKGKPLRLIVWFFIPIMLGSLFQQLYSMVDSIIVGKFVGVSALAGVGSTGSFNFLILGFCMGISTGLGIVLGQQFGGKDYEGMRKSLVNGFYLLGALTAVLTPLVYIYCAPLLRLMNTPEEFFEEAYTYISIIILGLASNMVYNAAASILRAVGDSRTPLLALLAASALNVVLDLVFIVCFGMGTAGAAVATVISQGLSGAGCMIYMFRRYEILRVRRGELSFSPARLKQILVISLPMALQFSITALGGVILQSTVNALGTVAVAAITAGSKICNMFQSAFDSVGVTMATYCSQNLGAGKPERIRQGVRSALLLSAGLCLAGMALIFLVGRPMAGLFADAGDTALMDDIVYYMRVNAVFFLLLGYLFVIRNSLQGMGHSFVTMFAGGSELLGRAVIAVLLIERFGFAGASLSNAVSWALADVILAVSYAVLMHRALRGTWGRKRKSFVLY